MLDKILEKPESYRHKVAAGSAFALTLMIAGVWAYTNGFFGFGTTTTVTRSESQQLIASVIASDSSVSASATKTAPRKSDNTANSPLDNTKNAFGAAFGEMGKKFDMLKESLASVLVPFITGIEVYEKTE
jgi:hypothetical protein